MVSGFDASRNIHLKQECVGAEWLDDELRWRVEMKDVESQRTYYKHTRFLITAVGFCDEPNGTEDILNIEDFHGQVFHSARWDHSVEFHGARVVVVGNGCSANQFIPHLVNQESVRTLTQVVRSRHWIAPKNDSPVPRWRKWSVEPFLPWAGCRRSCRGRGRKAHTNFANVSSIGYSVDFRYPIDY